MSYCRWSSDGYQCDLYCYDDVSGGYTTHVAAKRRPKRVTDYDFSSDEALAASLERQRAELEDPENEPVPIGLPHDGETFGDPDLAGLLARVRGLRAIGYQVPEWVDESIIEEMAGEGEG